MQRVQPPVTIEQLLKELAHSTYVHRTQQASKACQPPKEQEGGLFVLCALRTSLAACSRMPSNPHSA